MASSATERHCQVYVTSLCSYLKKFIIVILPAVLQYILGCTCWGSVFVGWIPVLPYCLDDQMYFGHLCTANPLLTDHYTPRPCLWGSWCLKKTYLQMPHQPTYRCHINQIGIRLFLLLPIVFRVTGLLWLRFFPWQKWAAFAGRSLIAPGGGGTSSYN